MELIPVLQTVSSAPEHQKGSMLGEEINELKPLGIYLIYLVMTDDL